MIKGLVSDKAKLIKMLEGRRVRGPALYYKVEGGEFVGLGIALTRYKVETLQRFALVAKPRIIGLRLRNTRAFVDNLVRLF